MNKSVFIHRPRKAVLATEFMESLCKLEPCQRIMFYCIIFGSHYRSFGTVAPKKPMTFQEIWRKGTDAGNKFESVVFDEFSFAES